MDGSSKDKLGPAGIGGVLRDSSGIILADFVVSVGIRDSNEAEFLAMVFALELSPEREWLQTGSLILESDSRIAFSWARSCCPWQLIFPGKS